MCFYMFEASQANLWYPVYGKYHAPASYWQNSIMKLKASFLALLLVAGVMATAQTKQQVPPPPPAVEEPTPPPPPPPPVPECEAVPKQPIAPPPPRPAPKPKD